MILHPSRSSRRRACLIAVLTAATAAALASSADAALVFSRFDSKSGSTIGIANDDGTGARTLATNAQSPLITPDGQTVFFERPGRTSTTLMQVPAAGGTAKRVVRDLQYGIATVSPDGASVAVTTGPLNGAQRLTLLTVATGATRVVATGYFFGASFSPVGDQLAYSRARRQDFTAPDDVFIAPVAGGSPRNLTADGHSAYPIWGPTQIAFSRWKLHFGPGHTDSGPAYNLSVINPDGSGRRTLTNDKVPFLISGLTATDWSADGTRLLAQFSGQDNTHAVGVDVATGAEHIIGPDTEFGLTGSALTADGATVLGAFGPPERIGNVVTIGWTGRTPKAIVRKADAPAWTLP
jgi:Tol biopolymer transport system component